MVSDGFDAMAVIVSCGPTWVLLRLLNATTCVGLRAPRSNENACGNGPE